MTLDEILEEYPEEEFLIAGGFNDAIIGVEDSTNKIVYSTSKCIEVLMRDMSEEEAIEYFYYNTIRANDYMGNKAPIFARI